MGKKTAQPETTEADQTATAIPKDAGLPTDEVTKLMEEIAQLRATGGRDMTLLCDGCKERLGRAHAGDERERNARYPEASQE